MKGDGTLVTCTRSFRLDVSEPWLVVERESEGEALSALEQPCIRGEI